MAFTLKPLSLSSGFVLSEFVSEFGPGASAHRFTKTQGDFHLALAHGYGRNDNSGLVPIGTHFKTFVAIRGLRIKRIRQRIRARG